MDKNIEIYVRQSASRNFLTVHASPEIRDTLLNGLREGSFECGGSPTHLELSILPEWITDEDQRCHVKGDLDPIHVRIPISVICTHFSD